MKQDMVPTIAEAAKLADVSRATAYRYFPNQESLLTEAPLELGIPQPEDIFGSGYLKPRDAEDRVALLERTVHDITFRDMAKIRMFMRTSMDRHLAGGNSDPTVPPTVPLRQGRRMELIEAALLPLKAELSARSHKTLSAALAIVIGIEAMIALTDTVQLKPAEAKQVKNWAVRALVRAARADATGAGVAPRKGKVRAKDRA